MNQKIKKILSELDRTRDRISELQMKLRDLERQKMELENTEYVAIIRSVNLTPDELSSLLKGHKCKPYSVSEDLEGRNSES